ncbi:hypothetical protein [Candidatus Xianfuyuplasma coldseepsis]|uniref:Uncharacterized protein n=1 Tax=Candidatus Xianfuyuplasma coldseepsis TaxID=2782163 RepID=A0A7L7KPT0_9MOLU|nr:hypothetical protein [Xianfuyuplasma coldseepsis]QMS84723.1 hypothetical protein G4Z02_02795 [Xianfuyuplasma coldseepsis]
MKRIVLLGIVLLTGFTLSGCDLIPQSVVEQVSEELCREDPTNELCLIDDLSDITETVAEELVIDAINTLNAADPELCDTVFSITNTDLIDACKAGTLLPEGVTSFTVLTFEQTGDTYTFKGSTGETSFMEVQMTIGDVDGNMRVTSFMTTVIDDPTLPADVGATEFENFFKQFISDYLNTAITTEALVASYFETAPDSDFAKDRTETQTSGVVITYVSSDLIEPNYYKVTLEFDENGSQRTEEVAVRVNRIEMALVLEFDDIDDDCDGIDDECVVDDPVTTKEFNTLLDDFIADYLDFTISDVDLEMMYFMNNMLSDFGMSRQDDLTNGLQITVVSTMMKENNKYDVTLEFTEDGTKRTETIEVRVNRIDMALYLEFDDTDDDCDGIDDDCDAPVTTEEFTSLFNQFILDYFDTTMSDADLEMKYFMEATLFDFGMSRQEDQTSGVIISLLSATPMEDNKFTVVLEFDENGVKRTETIEVRVNRIEMALYLEFDEGIDEDCDNIEDVCENGDSLVGDEAKLLLEAYFNDYSNPDIDNETFAMYYFNNMVDDMFADMRTQDLAEGAVYELLNVNFFDDGTFEAEFSRTAGTDYWIRKRPGRIRYETSAFVVEWGNPYDEFAMGLEAIDFLKAYFNDYGNPTISNQDFADMYLGGMLTEDFAVKRDMDLADGAVFAYQTVHFNEDGSFEVEYTRTVGEDIILRKRPGRIRKRPDLLTAEWDALIDEHIETDINVVTETFTAFVSDYLNPEISNDDLQAIYFGDMDMTWFFEQRQDDLTKGLMITVVTVEPLDEYGHFLVHVDVTSGEETMREVVPVKVMKRIDQTTPLLYILDGGGEDNDCDLIGDFCEIVTDPMMAESYMELFLQEYNNPDITNDVLQMYYLDYFWMLDMRQEDLAMGLMWSIDTVEHLDDNTFLFRLSSLHAEGVVHRDIAARVYHNGSIAYFRDKGVDPDGCILTTNVCHFMTVVDDEQLIQDIFVSFLQDFVNQDMTFEEINQHYFMGKAPEFLRDHFETNNPRGATVEFTSIMPNSDLPGFYDMAYSMVTPTFTKQHNVTVILWMVDGMPMFEFYDPNNDCHNDPYACVTPMMFEHNLDILNPFVEEFFVLLNDPTFSDDMIAAMFTDWMAPESLLSYRANGNGGAVFVFERIDAPDDITVDPFFTVTYTVTLPDQETVTESFRVQFVYTEMGLLMGIEKADVKR